MDLFLEVEPNPNCDPLEGLVYQALESPRRVRQIRVAPPPAVGPKGPRSANEPPSAATVGGGVARGGQDVLCWVTGVEPPGPGTATPRWVPAQVCKVTDSGAGVAYCVTGGRWGLRFQPVSLGSLAWDLADARQWGEPYKLYGDLGDLVCDP